ncbi:serpin family protein [Actinomadura macrotermitis]|uniref:Serpin domain-containing protein n=1 Tax=Actinomadura macrotermitis TaxID=2585200 RepID=A0A7K0BT29_9ACTN|nr:serpin family protein [Actinomadura macrotermitis]MQY04052.1 hypothetical protein [Actinomadura macrotermitis]
MLANDLTARWAAACDDSASFALSGAGVWPLLALLAAGADGPGRAELEKAAGVDAREAAEAARSTQAVLRGSSAVRAALGLWTHRDLPLEPVWLASLPRGTHGELTGDRAPLDAWAAEQTGGLIRRMPVEVDEDTRLVLAGALTIRTEWHRPFHDTNDSACSGPWSGRDFAALVRDTRITERVRVAETPHGPLTLLRVMGTGGIDVYVLLGTPETRAGDVLTTGIDALAGRHPIRAVHDGAPGVLVERVRSYKPEDRLRVCVPRFSIRSEHDLMETPELFGLATVSDMSRGHFPGISSSPLAVQQAAQDVVATFQARGFEAAVITLVGVAAGGAGGWSPPPPYRVTHVEFTVDRPFGFLTLDRRSGLALTAGWVAEPEDAAWD